MYLCAGKSTDIQAGSFGYCLVKPTVSDTGCQKFSLMILVDHEPLFFDLPILHVLLDAGIMDAPTLLHSLLFRWPCAVNASSSFTSMLSNKMFTSSSAGNPLPRAKLCSAEPASNEARFGLMD